jgi:hypothetical protein
MALVVVATLVVVAIPALVLLRGRRMFFYCLLALLVVLAATVGLGAVSVAQREQPLVALSATTAGDITTVVISASGSGLKSSQDMLVQVQAMSSFPDTMTKGLRVACGRDRFGPPHGSWPGSLLLWQQAGPDSSGAVSVRSTMEIPAGDYEGVCAFVALRKGGGIRFVQGFLRLKAAGT